MLLFGLLGVQLIMMEEKKFSDFLKELMLENKSKI